VPGGREDVFGHPGFLGYWTAETVSGFGTYVTTVALQVLVVVTLHGSATDVGLLNASRWLPYLPFGLVAGALVDRRRRRPVLVGTDLGRAVLLGLIPLLWLLAALTLPVLLGFVALFGVLSLLNDAASQSFVPRLVPRLAAGRVRAAVPERLRRADVRAGRRRRSGQRARRAGRGARRRGVALFSAAVVGRLRITEAAGGAGRARWTAR
jgi:hypothetical protein